MSVMPFVHPIVIVELKFLKVTLLLCRWVAHTRKWMQLATD